MRAKSGESPVQLEQLQGVAAQPTSDQEGWEPRRQEEQRTELSLHSGTITRKLWRTLLFQWRAGVFTDHVIHIHPLDAKRRSGEQVTNSKDFTHFGALTSLHLKKHQDLME